MLDQAVTCHPGHNSLEFPPPLHALSNGIITFFCPWQRRGTEWFHSNFSVFGSPRPSARFGCARGLDLFAVETIKLHRSRWTFPLDVLSPAYDRTHFVVSCNASLQKSKIGAKSVFQRELVRRHASYPRPPLPTRPDLS